MRQSAAPAAFCAAASITRGYTRIVLFCCVGTCLAACSEPFIVLSGDTLAGEVTDPPVDWTELNMHDIVQLETQPEDPYSVNIWMAGIGPDVYVATGEDGTNWTGFIEVDPDIRLRIDGKVYELEAELVYDPAERARVAAVYVDKYDLTPDDNWVLDGQVFRLDRR